MTPPLDSGADSTALHAIDFPLWGSRLMRVEGFEKFNICLCIFE